MGDQSKIEWTEATWNPTTGCTRVSPGCDGCYAYALHDQRFAAQDRAARAALDGAGVSPFKGPVGRIALARARELPLPLPAQYDKPFAMVQLHEGRLIQPLRWRRPRRVFVDSMSDLFHEDIPVSYIARVYAVMGLAWWHTFQILTKRPERRRQLFGDALFLKAIIDEMERLKDLIRSGQMPRPLTYSEIIASFPFENVWEGTSVEDQERANERVPELLATRAVVHFLSCEPLLGALWLTSVAKAADGSCLDALAGRTWGGVESGSGFQYPAREHLPHIDWVIVGGESGPRARPMELAWARSLVTQCKDAGVAVFVKQLGGRRPGNSIEELPEGLRVREFPR